MWLHLIQSWILLPLLDWLVTTLSLYLSLHNTYSLSLSIFQFKKKKKKKSQTWNQRFGNGILSFYITTINEIQNQAKHSMNSSASWSQSLEDQPNTSPLTSTTHVCVGWSWCVIFFYILKMLSLNLKNDTSLLY